MLAVDGLDRLLEPRQILFPIDVKIADLTCDQPFKRGRQSPHRQIDGHHFDVVDRAPPHPMERAQGDRWFTRARFLLRRPPDFGWFADDPEMSCCHYLLQSRTLRVDGG